MDLVGHSCVTNCVNCNSVYWFDQEEDEEVSPPFGQGALGIYDLCEYVEFGAIS